MVVVCCKHRTCMLGMLYAQSMRPVQRCAMFCGTFNCLPFRSAQADIEIAQAQEAAQQQQAAEAARAAKGSDDEDDDEAVFRQRAQDDWKVRQSDMMNVSTVKHS